MIYDRSYYLCVVPTKDGLIFNSLQTENYFQEAQYKIDNVFKSVQQQWDTGFDDLWEQVRSKASKLKSYDLLLLNICLEIYLSMSANELI